jgi:hypothetical protein
MDVENRQGINVIIRLSNCIGGFTRVKTTAISPLEMISESIFDFYLNITRRSYSELFQTIS